jgi:hypothetical protein
MSTPNPSLELTALALICEEPYDEIAMSAALELVFAPREDSQLWAAPADGTIEMH